MRLFPQILIILLLSFASVSGQIQRKYKEHGDKLMEKGDYAGALKNYHTALQIDSGKAELNYSYAQGLRMTNNYKKAVYYYKQTQKLDKDRNYVLSMYYAGEMYKYLGEYKKSLKEYNRFIKRYKGDRAKYEYQKSVFEIAHSRDLNHLLRDTLDLHPSNDHSVNTVFSEFGAFIYDNNHLMFSALRSDSLRDRLVLDSNRYYSRIYMAEKKDKWTETGKNIAFHDNEAVHIANAVYTPKSDFVYYSECLGKHCTIFRARNEQGSWSDFQALPEKINLPSYYNSQPILARIDGYDVLFFVSDRPGGYGKLDIYYTIAYSNGLFEDPVNLGDSINSLGNDICPFYLDEENALYFSSDWHSGLGGFDVFRSIRTGEKYFAPENLGIPFNSSYNDLYFRHMGNEAVLTSNRIGSLTDQFENCCNDLFFFEYQPKSIRAEVEMSELERIEKLLPLRLFFNNDEPNPRSNDTSTSVSYSATYVDYYANLSTFEREYSKGLKEPYKEEAKEEIAHFFENEIKLGYEDLKEALRLLQGELEKGGKIELIIRGFASPLSKADYNKRLTLRRISSIENELKHFNMGALGKFIENGQLFISRFPFGEDKIGSKVSDDLNDKRNAIYSKKASFERRVEIIAIKNQD